MAPSAMRGAGVHDFLVAVTVLPPHEAVVIDGPAFPDSSCAFYATRAERGRPSAGFRPGALPG